MTEQNIPAQLGAKPPIERIANMLSGIQQIALGLLPLGLCTWYYQTLVAHPIEKIYFTYSDGLLFVSDVLALVAVLAWSVRFLIKKIFSAARLGAKPLTEQEKDKQLEQNPLAWLRVWLVDEKNWGLALCLLGSLSVLWADDRLVSLFVSLHWWLVFGLALSVRAQPASRRVIAIGFCAALLVQIVIGFWQFGAQSTAFLAPLGLEWPGKIEPALRGASIVELSAGGRWLRVYGTLTHPNVLGGFTLMFLAGPAALFLFDKKRPAWALALLAGGAALLILTFSRSAWVGLAAAGLVFIFQRRKLPGNRSMAAGLAVLTGALSAAVPLYPLIFTRAGAGSAGTEVYSNVGRVWLAGQAVNIIKEHPLTGVGIGNFILEYTRRAPVGYLLEPVHSLPLLVVAELGFAGALIGIGLAFCIVRSSLKTTDQQHIFFSALLIGLLVTSLFDHYLWTLAPGQMLLGLAFGLFCARQQTLDAD